MKRAAMPKLVYLDNHATTAVDPRALSAMLPYFGEKFGNAASRTHRYGWEAEKAVELARRKVAGLAGASAKEMVFTSGATESVNLALKGVMQPGGHLLAVATEHHAVLDTARHLERLGCVVTLLRPGADGLISPDEFRAALRTETRMAAVMYANNEIGVIQPIREFGAICRERRVLFFCDAAQAFGKIPVNVEADCIDLMAISAHKLYGPKGVGALYVRRGVPVAAQMDGGGHEHGMRSGTLNVPGIVGFGEACGICEHEMPADRERTLRLRERLRRGLGESARVNGSLEHRLPGNLNVTFDGVDAAALLMTLSDIAVSTGSACSSATPEPSHVLQAIGLTAAAARSSVRFGVGRFNTEEEMDYAAERFSAAARKLRTLAPA
jgi:cysteine desulfurase